MNEKHVLLIGEQSDPHIYLLANAINEKGVDAKIFDPTHYCTEYRSAMAVNEAGRYYGKLRFPDGEELASDKVTAIWRKHMIYPEVPCFIADEDRCYVREENRFHMGSLMASFSPKALQANPWKAYYLVENKILQLQTACEVGIVIPQTLISNTISEIAAFIRRQEAAGHQVVCKSSSASNWEEDGRIIAQSTAIVSAEDLPSQRMMGATPMIFQTRIKARAELRVTVFGCEVHAVSIHSKSEVDWRVKQHDESFQVEPYLLPEAVRTSILKLFKKLGLTTGSVDLMVTPEGDYVFIEVNESGQFLWIEQVNPEIPMLDMAAEFLLSGDDRFIYKEGSAKKCVLQNGMVNQRQGQPLPAYDLHQNE